MLLGLLKSWLCLFSLFGYSFTVKKFTNQRLGFLVMMSLITICCLSYIYSIFFEDLSTPIKFFYYGGLLLLAIFIFYTLAKNKSYQPLQENIFNSSSICLLIAATVTYFLYHPNSFFHEWDEFTHWGITIKEIYIKNRLFRFQDIADNNFSDGCYNYPPISSISHYFFIKNISSEFNEADVLFANALFLLLPFFFCFDLISKNLRKSWIGIVVTLFLTFLYVTLIIGRRFTFIYVDSHLGLMFGIVCSHILLSNRNNKSEEKLFNVVLFFTTFFLVLLKDFGLFFATITIPLLFWRIFFIKAGKLEVFKKDLVSAAISCFAIVLSRLSWQKVVTGTFFSYQNLSLGREVNLLHLSDIQITILKNYLLNWLSCFKFTEYYVLEIFLAILVASLFTKNFLQKREKNVITLSLYYIASSYTIYSLCFSYLYLTKFTEYESLISASYDRYLLTSAYGYLVLTFCLIAQIIAPKLLQKISIHKISQLWQELLYRRKNYQFLFFATLTISLAIVLIIRTGKEVEQRKDLIKRDIITDLNKSPFGRSDLKVIAHKMLPYLQNGKKVLLLYHNLEFPQCWIMNYELSPYSDVLKNADLCFLTQDSYIMNDEEEKKKMKFTAAKFSIFNRVMQQELSFDLAEKMKDYNILFIPKPDDQLWQNIGHLFKNNYQNHQFFVLDSDNKFEPLQP